MSTSRISPFCCNVYRPEILAFQACSPVVRLGQLQHSTRRNGDLANRLMTGGFEHFRSIAVAACSTDLPKDVRKVLQRCGNVRWIGATVPAFGVGIRRSLGSPRETACSTQGGASSRRSMAIGSGKAFFRCTGSHPHGPAFG